MHILIDQDGVLADWSKRFAERARSDYPHIPFPFLENNNSWDMSSGLDEEGLMAIEALKSLPGFYAELEPIEGSVEALYAMLDAGHSVSIVTSPWVPNVTCASDKLNWLEKHFGAGWGNRAVITSDKTLVMGDILIDDRPDIEGIYDPRWEHIIFDAPYNLAINDGRRRLATWKDWESLIS